MHALTCMGRGLIACLDACMRLTCIACGLIACLAHSLVGVAYAAVVAQLLWTCIWTLGALGA